MLTDEGGQFPSLMSILNSDEFINADDEYFGDQKINQVLVEAANQDITQFQYLPYTQYATTIYPDYTGPAYMGKVRLGGRAPGLRRGPGRVRRAAGLHGYVEVTHVSHRDPRTRFRAGEWVYDIPMAVWDAVVRGPV